MRHTAHAMLGVFLVVLGCCHNAVAEESKSRWWPFGGGDKSETAATDSAASTAKSAPATTAVPSPPVAKSPPATTKKEKEADIGPVEGEKWMVNSPFERVSWPELRMPKVAMPKAHLPRPQIWPDKSKPEAPRNSWVHKDPEPESSSPMKAVSNGAHRVATGTKNAWHKTVAAITPGDDSTPHAEPPPRIASKDLDPPLWKRMFGAKEEKPEGPRTVTEWMAQERLGP